MNSTVRKRILQVFTIALAFWGKQIFILRVYCRTFFSSFQLDEHLPLIKEGNLIYLLLFWKFCVNMFVITRHFQYQSFGYVQMSCLKTMQSYDFYWSIICLWWYAGSNFLMSCKRWFFFLLTENQNWYANDVNKICKAPPLK